MPTYTPDTLEAVAKSLVAYSVASTELASVDNRITRLPERQQEINEIKERLARLAGRVA